MTTKFPPKVLKNVYILNSILEGLSGQQQEEDKNCKRQFIHNSKVKGEVKIKGVKGETEVKGEAEVNKESQCAILQLQHS